MIKYQYISSIINVSYVDYLKAEIIVIFARFGMPIRKISFKMVH